jgi:hypothetical protein
MLREHVGGLMKAVVVNSEAVGHHKRNLQFYLKDSNEFKSYGPLQSDMGSVFASRELGKSAAETELRTIRSIIKNRKLAASSKLMDGNAGSNIIVISGRGEGFEDFAGSYSKLKFKRVGVTDRMKNSLDWPLPEVELAGELESCVAKQYELNQMLRKIDDDYLMPLKLAGVEHNAAVQWLLGRRVNAGAKGKIDEILKTLGGEQSKLNEEKAAALFKVDRKSSEIESLLKLIDEKNFLEFDYENMRVIPVLSRPKGRIDFKNGKADSFGGVFPENSSLEKFIKKIEAGSGVCGFDIETKHWWTDKPIVYLIAIVSDKGNFVGGEFDIGKNYVEAFTGEKAEYFCFKNNEAALIKWAGDKMRELDPLLVITQNGINYDYVELAERGNFFRIGPDNLLPKKTSASQGVMSRKSYSGKTLTRRGHPSSFDFDMLAWVKNNLRFALPDARLETIVSVAHNFFKAKVGYTKSHTYEQQKVDVELAQTNPEIAYGLSCYVLEDAIASVASGKKFIPIPLKLAQAINCSLNSAFNERNRKLAVFFESRKQYQQQGRPRNDSRYISGITTKAADAKAASSAATGAGVLMTETKLKRQMYVDALAPEFAKGMFKGVAVGYLPLYPSIPQLAEGCRQKIIELASKAENPLEKIIYSKFLDEFTAEPLIKICRKEDYGLWTKYKVGGCGELEKQMREWLAAAKQELAGSRILNLSDGLLFLEKGADTSGIEKKGFVKWADADIISVGKGEIVYKICDELLSTGVRIPSVKRWQECDAPKDYHPNIKIRAMRQFVDNVFADKETALKNLAETARALAENKIPLIDYLQRIGCRELPENLGDREQSKIRAVVAKQFDLKLGEYAIFGVSFDSSNGQEVYVRYDPELRKFDRAFVPFTKHYQDRIFGEKSRMWDLASAVYLNEKDAQCEIKKSALESIMRGKGTEEEIKLLSCR